MLDLATQIPPNWGVWVDDVCNGNLCEPAGVLDGSKTWSCFEVTGVAMPAVSHRSFVPFPRSTSIPVIFLTVLLAFIPLGASARAALWVEITVTPGNPQAGEVTTVRVQTFSRLQSDCINDLHADPVPDVAYTGETYPTVLDTFQVTAATSGGEEYLILLERSPDDGSIWEGEFIFPEQGEWSLVMSMPYWPHIPVPDPCSGAAVVITVHPSASAPPVATPLSSPIATPAS